ncbi:MAG: hypothetical protein HY293_09215 [Planctomycetes bacterium]|nr:hypothetical protein [Planctomycetota bacterium]
MKVREHDDAFGLGDEEDSVGEAPDQGPTDVLADDRETKRAAGDALQNCIQGEKEFTSQPGDAGLTLATRIGHVGLCFGPDDDRPTHERFRMRFLTTAQGEPFPGFRR